MPQNVQNYYKKFQSRQTFLNIPLCDSTHTHDKHNNYISDFTCIHYTCQQGDRHFISCPSCRKPTHLSAMGATDLPAAFLINNLLQLQEKMKKALYDVGCELHHDLLKVYFETCQELICRDCAVSKQHQNHEYKLITECYPDHHQEIETNLTIVKKKVADINTALTDLIIRENATTKQGEDIKEEIHTEAQLLVNLVQQSERLLVQQVDTTLQQKIPLLNKQRKEVETVLNHLKRCEKFVEQSLKVGSQQQVLREKQSIIQVMTKVNH